MKKALALVLALVMVFSMGTMAFATNGTDDVVIVYEEETIKECPICGNTFIDAAEYNKHLEVCDVKADGSETIMYDFTIKEILEMIVTLVSGSMTQWNDVETIIIKIIGFVEKIAELGAAAVPAADVKGAVADLEALLADVKLPKVEDLLTGLKQKIKDLYAGEVATTVVVEETTVAEEIIETGSSSVGIALFAAVSVAAAAAYVCTKKSK